MRQSAPHPPERHAAFSLIELLVAIGITSLMMLLIGRIVGETQQAVSRGVELGEVIALSRSIESQMQADADAMFGPDGVGPGSRGGIQGAGDVASVFTPGTAATAGDIRDNAGRSPLIETGGVLVIAKHAFANQPWTPADGTATTRLIYSDQLAFIRERLDERALTPASAESYLTAADLRAAPYERVWYGHLSKTDPDGTPIDPAAPLFNGEPDPLLWLLGRHATLLFEEPEALTLNASSAGSDVVETLPPVYALGVAPGSGVVGFGNGNPVGPYPPSPAPQLPMLASGLTDSAFYALSEPSDAYSQNASNATGDPRRHRNGAIVGGWPGNYSERSNPGTIIASSPGDRLWSNLGNAAYLERAVNQLTFAAQRPGASVPNRLRANPYPLGGTFEPWRLAQSHAILAEGATDFIVEFAADTNADGEVDTVTAAESNRAYGDTRAEGQIKWYTDEFTDNNAENTGAPTAIDPAFDPTRPLTFAPAGGSGVPGPSNPAQAQFFDTVYGVENDTSLNATAAAIRFDTNGGTSSAIPREASVAFVFRHDGFDPSPGAATGPFFCNWPYLLRIRYRLHDGAGRLAGPDSDQGIWFEQILRVDRPLPG